MLTEAPHPATIGIVTGLGSQVGQRVRLVVVVDHRRHLALDSSPVAWGCRLPCCPINLLPVSVEIPYPRRSTILAQQIALGVGLRRREVERARVGFHIVGRLRLQPRKHAHLPEPQCRIIGLGNGRLQQTGESHQILAHVGKVEDRFGLCGFQRESPRLDRRSAHVDEKMLWFDGLVSCQVNVRSQVLKGISEGLPHIVVPRHGCLPLRVAPAVHGVPYAQDPML